MQRRTEAPRARIIESLVVGAAGATLGRLAGGLLGREEGWAAAAIAGANGLISGWRRTYSWRTPTGWVAFVLDSTWALLTTVAGLVAHLVAAVTKGRYEPSLSTRQGRHVYRGGVRLKPRFALTLGNVVSNAGNVDGARRRRLVTDHEAVHVWQARWLGPIYPIVYVGWAAIGTLAGAVMWLVRGRRERLGTVVESVAYYCNPCEWWAYSRDANWPPKGKVTGVGWTRPAARAFSAPSLDDGHDGS
ncbi:MAG: hypothetical protein HZB15_15800 [Actinobacteria bacterium]|nr:hypothetical protein [Actinomycetota bacterium]